MPPLTHWGLIGKCIGPAVHEVHVVKLKSVAVEVLVRGFVAKVCTRSTYINATEKTLEVEYRIPVDESAAVYRFEATINEHKITAQCMEKKKAENVYKEAVKSGHVAVLAREDQLTADILHLALGNLPPGGKAEVKLHMIMELKVKTDGAVTFTLPTVLVPRYCPEDITNDQHTASVATFGFHHSAFTDVITVREPYSIDIKAKVSGGPAVARIISHSDPLNVIISEDGMSAEITQDGGFKPDHDWGMLVYYSNPYKTHIIRETGERSSTGLMKDDLIMINMHPEVPKDSYSNKNEIIFIVDRSGSMLGENMQSARSSLLLFLKALPTGVYFNIISFGSDYSLLFPGGSEMFSEATLEKALVLQESMDADMGGTEILQPLKHVYNQPLKSGYGRQIILLSDGEVFNVDQVKQLVSRHAHETRVFSVGIGNGASTALINGLARAGRGRSEMVYQQDKLQFKVMGLVTSMLQENVQEMAINFDVDPPCGVKLVPKVPPIIFGGQHIILYARVPPATMVKSINIKGVVGNANLKIGIQGSDIITAHDEDMSLHRLAARAQIVQWQVDEEEDVGDDMIALSVASGVVSRLTALVGVDQDKNPVVAEPQPTFQTMNRPLGGVFTFRGLPSNGPTSGGLFRCSDARSTTASGSSAISRTPASGGFFGSSAAPNTCTLASDGLFGSSFSSSIPASGGPFGFSTDSIGPAIGGCFGSSFASSLPASGGPFCCSTDSSAPASGGLFGSSTASSVPASGGFIGNSVPESCRFFRSPITLDTQPNGGLFGSSAAPSTPANGGLFGSFAAPNTQASGGLFGNSAAPNTQASSELLGNSAAPNTQASSGLFGNSAAPNTQASGSLFGSSAIRSTPANSVSFGCPSTSVSSANIQSIGSTEPQDNGFMSVVKLQKFDGSWSLQDATQLTSLPIEHLRNANTDKNELAWATAVVLALLKTKFSAEEDLWVLLAYKARNFISSCGEDPNALHDAALSLFGNN